MLKSLSELFKQDKDGFYNIENAAYLFTDSELSTIAQQVRYDYDQDLTTCYRKLSELKQIMALAMIVSDVKSYPWNGASNVIFPLIANAAINFGASCYPEIIQDGEVVKAKIIGNDRGKIATFNGEKQIDEESGEFIRQGAGDKLKRGNRVATMMNWQLLEQMTWWESDIDKEVHTLPIVGTLYKKIYYDPLKKMSVSELIFPDKIVINNGARDIDSSIVTQIIELYPQEILQRIRSGFYCDFDFELKEMESQSPDGDANTTMATPTIPTIKQKEEVRSNTNLHCFLEQHTWMDLDKDGFLEPYVITIHYDTNRVVRIIPRFEEGDIKYNKDGKIQEIEACKYFVVRRFLPSFDGGFLGIGFGHLLSNMNNAINTTLNQMIDAGHLSITGGGLISKNVKLRGGKLSISLNEYKLVDVAGSDLASSIYSFPKTEPSPVLFTLLGLLIESGRELGSMRDVLNGEGAANMPATTYMGMVDQGYKQFKSIFKRYYKSLKSEFALLYALNAKYLSNKDYLQILDDEDEQSVSVKIDFDQRSYNIVPVADVNSIVSAQKFAQANFLSGFIGSQNVNQEKLVRRIFEIARITDTDDLIIDAAPQIDPALQIAKMEQNVKMSALEVAAQKNNINLQKLQVELPKMATEIEEIKSKIMVNFANVGKISRDTELAESKERLDVMDNIVDAEVKQQEMALRAKQSDQRHIIDIAKIQHDAAKHIAQINYKKELNQSKPTTQSTTDDAY